MITKDSSDKDILDHPLDQSGNTIRNIGSMSFLAWMSKKVDGAPSYRGATQELLGLLKAPPMGPMPEGEKIKVVRKMLELDITL